MVDPNQKTLPEAPPGADGNGLLDRPAEEKLRDEIESLKRQLEQERKKHERKKPSGQNRER